MHQPRPRGAKRSGAKAQYLMRWYTGPDKDELRLKFNGDRTAYISAMRDHDDTCLKFLESGMRAYAMLERRGLRKFWTTHGLIRFECVGAMAANALLAALSSHARMLTTDSDFLLASIDIEGQARPHGFGIALFDTRTLLRDKVSESEHMAEVSIEATNFRTHRVNTGFVFGPTTKTTPEMFKRTIVEALTIPDDVHTSRLKREQVDNPMQVSDLEDDPLPPLDFDETSRPSTPTSTSSSEQGSHVITPRKIILVGHHIANDIEVMRSQGIDFESDLPSVVGLLDTADLARTIYSHYPKLCDLLNLLGIRHWRHELHCAGNDAVYTLKAMMALLFIRSKQELNCPIFELHEFAHRELPVFKPEPKFRDDWDTNLSGNDDDVTDSLNVANEVISEPM